MVNITILMLLAETEPVSWDMLRQIIQTQEWLAYYAITATLVLVGIILAATWLSNFIVHRQAINKAIEEIKKETREVLKEDYATCIKRIESKVQEIEKGVGKSIGKEIAKLREDISREITLLEAEKARVFAIVAEEAKGDMSAVCDWWATAIIKYVKASNDEGIRISVDALVRTLTKCKSMEKNELDSVKQCINLIPSILNKEKQQIENSIDKLQESQTKSVPKST